MRRSAKNAFFDVLVLFSLRSLPKLTAVRAIGAASGELSAALGSVSVPLQPPTPPYHNLWAVHHAVTRDSFCSTMAGPAMDGVRASADALAAEVRAMELKLEGFRALRLPEQLVHGDLHYDNVLVAGGEVTGVRAA